MKAAISACLITDFTQARLRFKGSFNKREVKLERRKKLNRTIVALLQMVKVENCWLENEAFSHWRVSPETPRGVAHTHEPALGCARLSNSHSLLAFKNPSWNNNNNKMVFIYSSLSCTALQNSSDMVRFYYMAEGSGKQDESKNFLWKIKQSFIQKLEFLLSSHN